ncbi:MAG: TrkH family potassium uptake protein [Treponema sp.]|jgi:trk system potassium uptake protein TrkH|nr:TrkH family potassium uptake protein [Treponema sp.]
MKRPAIIRLLAIITAGVSAFMLPSLVTALVLQENSMIFPFLLPMIIGLVIAIPFILFIPKVKLGIRSKDGFLLVFLVWIISTLMGSLCYYFASAGISWVDSIFESACGFSTTGATTISNIETLPRSLLLWRSISQWAGGMGIILLFVALLPFFGSSGFQLIKAEVPGPEKDRVKPKITSTAKIAWGVYCIFTLALIILYRFGGMNWFDAVCHGFTIISTGGLSTKNAGLNFFNSSFIDWVTIIFMLLGAMNFTLYYKIAKGKFKDFFINTEARAFLAIFFISAVITSIKIIPMYGSIGEAFRFGSFQAASILTTTGSVSANYTLWPALAQTILLLLMLSGGCSGSTSGGIKVIRHVFFFKQTGNELKKIIYPNGVFTIRLNRRTATMELEHGVMAFVFLYIFIVGLTTIITAASGIDVFSSLCTSLSITGNIGVGFGAAGPFNNFSDFPDYLKLYYSLVMIAGRLELWTVFVLFTPEFWKK